MKSILITGGAGFVGSYLAIRLKEHFRESRIIAMDNLYRRGSEINPPRLEAAGIEFIKGDVRNPEDLAMAGKISLLIECSAEPSVLSGKDGDTSYLIGTNLQGAINCAGLCRKYAAPMVFLSTSRVYPIHALANANIEETETRLELSDSQQVSGLSSEGVSEDFLMTGARSLYGGTKFAAEIMLAEYRHAFDLPVIINRCGVIAGPGQFGKADQGIAAFWCAAHYFERPLKYIGFGGHGKQVRDFLHIEDLFQLILLQMAEPEKFSRKDFFNVGGGRSISASLRELTEICREVTGKTIIISSEPETRYADIPVYLSDTRKIKEFCNWSPKFDVAKIITDINQWLKENPNAHYLFK